MDAKEIEKLFDEKLSQRLSEDEVFVGLIDHGLFCEKLPPCFSTEGLTNLLTPEVLECLNSTKKKELKMAGGSSK